MAKPKYKPPKITRPKRPNIKLGKTSNQKMKYHDAMQMYHSEMRTYHMSKFYAVPIDKKKKK